MAREEKRYHSLLQSTTGIMFMGTPHDGADKAKLASTAIKIVESLSTIPLNDYQVKTLKRGSEQLQDISRSFGFLQDLKIVTVIESDETTIPYLGRSSVGRYSTYLISGSSLTGQRLQVKVVSNTSAHLNLGDRENCLIAAGADHHMVCKFSGEDDRNYPKIRNAIIELAASPIGR